MDTCPECGTWASPEAEYCSRCGSRLPDRRASTPLAAPPPLGYGPAPQQRRSRAPLIATVVVGCTALAIVVAGLAGATMWWFGQRSRAGVPVAAPMPTAAHDVRRSPTPTSAPQTRTATRSPAATSSPSPRPSPTPTGFTDFAALYKAVSSGVAEVVVHTCDGTVTGSGFLVSQGRLVTAAHVINGASTISVHSDDGVVQASIVGVDKSVDLAVLRLAFPVHGHVFRLAASLTPPGTHIVTIGYPLSGPKTLTEGTVSGVGRKIRTESGTQTDMLQTDAPINPGNSGGPLVTLSGQVTGFADAVRIDAQGIGYAVPSRDFRAQVMQSHPTLTPVSAVRCQRHQGESGAEAISAVIAYHEAINTLDYDSAMQLLTPSFAASLFPDEEGWYTAYATTYDDDFQVVDGALHGSNADVDLTFRSQQAPGYGPSGAVNATCLRWNITYHLTRQDGRWLLDGATPADPAWQRC